MLGQVKEEGWILASNNQRQLKFSGHIVKENSLERLVFEGKIKALRSKGRQRKKYLDDLVAAVGCLRKGELFHLTQERERLRCMVVKVNRHGTTRRSYARDAVLDMLANGLVINQNIKWCFVYGCRENSEAQGQKRKIRPPASEARRKFSGLETNCGKLLLVSFMRRPDLE